eukprot:160003_1
MGNEYECDCPSSSEDGADTDEEEIIHTVFEMLHKMGIDPNNLPNRQTKSNPLSKENILTMMNDPNRGACSQHTDKPNKEIKVKINHLAMLSNPSDIFKRNHLSINTNINYHYNSDSEYDSEYEWHQSHGRNTKRVKDSLWLQGSESFTNKRKQYHNKWRLNEWNRIHILRNNHQITSYPNANNTLYELEIYLIGIHPRITRKIKIISHLSLAVIHDKIFCPLFGFKRNFHAYQFRRKHYKYKRISYGPRYAQSVDMMHINPISGIKKVGSCMLEAQFVRLNDLLINIGDEIRYDYDLGEAYSMNITLTNIANIMNAKNVKLVEIIDGSRAGPPENMEGNRGYVERLNVLCKYKYDLLLKENNNKFIGSIHEIINSPNLVHLDKQHIFDPEVFDKDECIMKMKKCFKSILSKQSGINQLVAINCKKGDERWNYMYKQLWFCPRICHNNKCRKLSGNIINRSDEMMKLDKRFKTCSRCLSVFYCDRKCQKIHWKQKHRYNCRQFSGIYQHYNMKYVNDDTFCSKLP